MEERENGIRTIYRTGAGELTEKKSRFLSFIYEVESEEEIGRILENMRKKYWDARHVCYAYVLGDRGGQQRFSDDGEPSGTAGKPMLDVLTGAGLTNTLVVAVRYFGGVLLGTGGLVRAYSGAAREALDASVVVTKQAAKMLNIALDYTAFGKVQYLLGQEEIAIAQAEYADNVLLKVPIPLEKLDMTRKKIIDVTSASADIQEGEELYFAIVDKQVVYF